MGLSNPKTIVLRMGHRPGRDKRVTTHVALAARALGASGFILAGECDSSIIGSILKVEEQWGRGLEIVSCGLPWKFHVELWKEKGWPIVHLTMYGEPLERHIEVLRQSRKPVMVVVGAEKVPRKLYELADYNISITNQPHSEVSALAIFLDRLYSGRELYYFWYENPKLIIEPSSRGKRVKKIEGKKHGREYQSVTTGEVHREPYRP